MPLSDDLPDGNRVGAAEELPVHVSVNGTTFRATYKVKGATVLLTSVEFGNVTAALGGVAPEAAAARRLRELAEAAMARSDTPYLRDDEAKPADP